MKNYKLICMSFDGEFVKEGNFDSIDKVWNYNNDIGSKWYFYPFRFIGTDKTIIDAVDELSWTINKRIKTVSSIFEEQSKKPELEFADIEEYIFSF